MKKYVVQEKLQMSHSFSFMIYKTNDPRSDFFAPFFFVGIMISFQVLFVFSPAVLLTAEQEA